MEPTGYVCVCGVCACVETQRKIYFKELAHAIVGLASPKSAEQAGTCRPRAELMLQLESRGCLLAEFPLPQGTSVFFPLKAVFKRGPPTLWRVISFILSLQI